MIEETPPRIHNNLSLRGAASMLDVSTKQKHEAWHPPGINPNEVHSKLLESEKQLPENEYRLIGHITNQDTKQRLFFHVQLK